MKRVLFATTNQNKIKEVVSLLKALHITTISPKDISGAPKDVKETGQSFEENACIKAKAFGKASGLITLADDTGLEVDALGGSPGVYSARYAPTDKEKIKKLLKELKDVPDPKRTARFVSVICIYDPKTKGTQTVRGTVAGKITTAPRGNQGFGYDSVFYSTELKKTFGEDFKGKQRVSHRARALKKATKILKNWG